jgi:hypothetical protein
LARAVGQARYGEKGPVIVVDRLVESEFEAVLIIAVGGPVDLAAQVVKGIFPVEAVGVALVKDRAVGDRANPHAQRESAGAGDVEPVPKST